MNNYQRENLSKMWFDLVKIPLALCMLGPLVSGVDQIIELEVFGSALVVFFVYMGFITGENL